MTTLECAEYHGVTQQAIRAAIAREELPAKKWGRDWQVKRSDCEAYQPIRYPRHRKNKDTPAPPTGDQGAGHEGEGDGEAEEADSL